MTSLFPDLRTDLVGAMERGPRRSRRAPVALAMAVAVALIVVGITTIGHPARPTGTVTATPTPEHLPPAIAESVLQKANPISPGTPVLQLRVGDGAIEWDTAAWGTRGGSISLTQAPHGARSQRWGTNGWGTSPIAASLLAGPLGGLRLDGALLHGKPHFVVVGIVESRATGVSVALAGQRQEAALSAALLTRPLVIDPAGLTRRGRDLAKRLPREISVRLFAAAFAPAHPPATRTLSPRVRVTRPDGTTSVQRGPRFCVARPCGTVLPKLG